MILVIGAGAVGSLLGATLAAGGEAVVLLRRGVPADVGHSQLAVSGPGLAGPTVRVGVTVAGSAGAVQADPEIIVIAVKMPDLDGALATAAAWPDASVVAVENGVGADDAMLAQRPQGGLVAGSLTTSVERAADGSIRRLSRGGIVLAPVRGHVGSAIARLVDAFERGGLRARSVGDPAAMRWSKLLLNLMGNASGAIVDMDPAAVYRDPALFRIERRQLAEALNVMRGLGLRPIKLYGADTRLLAIAGWLPDAIVRPILIRVVSAGRGGKRPSLHLHLAGGIDGPSEVGWLNGAVARAADGLGQSAPVNAALADLLAACTADPDRRAWFQGRPDRLAEAIASRV